MKIWNTISYITIGITALFLLVMGYWLLYPYNPTDFPSPVQKVDKLTVQSGEHLIITSEFCKNMTVVPTISRSFVDGIIYQIPSYTAIEPELGCHTRKVQVYIPKGLPLGRYYIHSSYKWQVNPIRAIEKTTTTEVFYVVNGQKD